MGNKSPRGTGKEERAGEGATPAEPIRVPNDGHVAIDMSALGTELVPEDHPDVLKMKRNLGALPSGTNTFCRCRLYEILQYLLLMILTVASRFPKVLVLKTNTRYFDKGNITRVTALQVDGKVYSDDISECAALVLATAGWSKADSSKRIQLLASWVFDIIEETGFNKPVSSDTPAFSLPGAAKYSEPTAITLQNGDVLIFSWHHAPPARKRPNQTFSRIGRHFSAAGHFQGFPKQLYLTFVTDDEQTELKQAPVMGEDSFSSSGINLGPKQLTPGAEWDFANAKPLYFDGLPAVKYNPTPLAAPEQAID